MIGVTILAVVCASVYKIFSKKDWTTAYPTAITGALSHVILDSFLYPDIKPLYPLTINPLFEALSPSTVINACITALIAALPIIYYKKIRPR
jgi:membrane-bound metal-dependent hydrolase YbcI (DUF457 family)